MKYYFLLNRMGYFNKTTKFIYQNSDEVVTENLFEILTADESENEDEVNPDGIYLGSKIITDSFHFIHFYRNVVGEQPLEFINNNSLKQIIDNLVKLFPENENDGIVFAIHFGNKEGNELKILVNDLNKSLNRYKNFVVTYYTSTAHEDLNLNQLLDIFENQVSENIDLQLIKKQTIELLLPLAIDFQGLESVGVDKRTPYLIEILNAYNFNQLENDFNKYKYKLSNFSQYDRFTELINDLKEHKKRTEFSDLFNKYIGNDKKFSFPQWLSDLNKYFDKKI